MSPPDRTLIRRRLVLIVAVVIVALVVAAVLARPLFDGDVAEPPAEDAGPPGIKIDTPPLPIPDPPLSRAEVIALATRAASAYATGSAPLEDDAKLVGRSFSVQIPFGCEGPRPSNGATSGAYWEHDQARGTITLRAHPVIWTEADWVKALAAPAKFDAVEGFWVPRPWILSEACPKAPPAPAPAAEGEEAASAPAPAPVAEERTLGLAHFFAPNSSRVQQRGSRPYEFVTNAPTDGAAIAPRGFRLTLAGRIAGYEDGRPVRCRVRRAGERPVCLVAVEFDRVAFEDPATGKTLAEWRTH